jgi:hypothetical protein
MPADEAGYVGRECPQPECLGFFKIKFGTGLKEAVPCHCPYCGCTDDHSKFWTQEQIGYARSIMLNTVNKALRKDVKEMDRRLRHSSRNSLIKFGVSFKGRSHPIRYYQEKELETHIICDRCTLQYAIYGVFAYCPDCGIHNSLQILKKNLELAKREIALAKKVEDTDLAEHLIADALENAVSAFDGFGREACRIHAAIASEPAKANNLSFQNLSRVQENLQKLFGLNLAAGLAVEEWTLVVRCIQKRHLLAHKMGVVDEAYLSVTKDSEAIIGRKVSIKWDEVPTLLVYLEKLGGYVFTQLTSKASARSTAP